QQQQQPQQQQQQASIKTLAVTSRITKGSPPPPLMGSAIVLVNDSALHCFGGRLESREITNCHYVLDVETGYWQAINPVNNNNNNSNNNGNQNTGNYDSRALLSLSLSTDPVNTNSASLSGPISIPPRPRYFHTLNAYGTYLIVFGGMGLDQDNTNLNEPHTASQLTALDDLHVFDIVAQRWEQKRPPHNEHSPRARWAHMATILDHFLLIIGGTDTAKVYMEDACVLDLHTWEWVASVRNIGQCGSYRTVAATGPSMQSSPSEVTPSSPSFPSAAAAASPVTSSQVSSSLSWLVSDTDSADVMASISMILSGRISVPSSEVSSVSTSSESKDSQKDDIQKKTSERLASGELTPSFKTGKEIPSIYLYSNYNFQNLQREFKIITPHYTQSSTSPSFSLVDKSQTLENMGKNELPPGLRFPQAHVYQNRLLLTGTLIISGNAPTLAIYTLDLTTDKWERLDTGPALEKGSWNRSLLHPASGTLFIFGNNNSNPDQDYSSRTQHHDHIVTINLQAYGLYERPVPSFTPLAQELGQDLLSGPGFSDMHIASVNGTLFDANSTVLAARWPEFSSMLLSPPYVTPLILVLPVPDDVVPVFLHYLYTGALPSNEAVTPAIADHLFILARQYELNGLHALTLDVLHQTVATNPVRVHSSALMAGELGLQARAVGLAMAAIPAKLANQQDTRPQSPAVMPGQDHIMPPTSTTRKRTSAYVLDSGLSRNYSNRVPPPSSRPPVPPERRRQPSRDSVSTDGGLSDSLLQQYTLNSLSDVGNHLQQPYMSSPEPGMNRQRKARSPPMLPNQQTAHPVSFISTSSSGSIYDSGPIGSPTTRGPQQYTQQQQQSGYSSPGNQHLTAYPSQGGYMRNGTPSVYSHDDQDDLRSVSSGSGSQIYESRNQQAKKRLQQQMQMQTEMEPRRDIIYHNPGATAEIYLGGGSSQGTYLNGSQVTIDSQRTAESTLDTVSSQKSSGSSKASIKSSSSDKDKKKGILAKMKPPKPKASGAELMRGAGF
ncbi:hypothetical protein BGZ49_002239, partial [Haplosporangium sp. Z 27]